MKPAAAWVLLWAALLLLSRGDCDICPAVDRDVHTFLKGTADEYVEAVSQYRNDSAVLANARTLKICIDHSLTKEDKAHVLSFLDRIFSSPFC
ncbi:major allergen I polypeptide chain 1-like [Manis javanica]|uniref:major allergen I polypeptide chain 1-like n=1 Tax=Manis javanica TaxID=9974 RepID=UPI000813B3B1|nr:major allergen I polypeptide chain 1-like [Manis javanica]KAI5928959.1 Pyrroline-5-carboxylate reductase 3 [Manis javanica]